MLFVWGLACDMESRCDRLRNEHMSQGQEHGHEGAGDQVMDHTKGIGGQEAGDRRQRQRLTSGLVV